MKFAPLGSSESPQPNRSLAAFTGGGQGVARYERPAAMASVVVVAGRRTRRRRQRAALALAAAAATLVAGRNPRGGADNAVEATWRRGSVGAIALALAAAAATLVEAARWHRDGAGRSRIGARAGMVAVRGRERTKPDEEAELGGLACKVGEELQPPCRARTLKQCRQCRHFKPR